MMQQSTYKSKKEHLKGRYIEANLATQIALEKNRLSFLQKCLVFKRPPQSLRVRGLSGMPDNDGRLLVQEVEYKALLYAIEEKKKLIVDMEKSLRSEVEHVRVDGGLVAVNKRKLLKKLNFYRVCEDTKWVDWQRRDIILHQCADKMKDIHVASVRKWKQKIRAKRRKLFKKEALLRNVACLALETGLVRNLTDVPVPEFSIAVLSYGPGWIPTPNSFDENQFKVDAANAANKQVWSAIFKDSTDDTNNVVPLSLLKNPVTAPAPLVDDFVVNQAKEVIVDFAKNVSPSKCKSKLNRFELEGLSWLKNAVNSKQIAITQADKGGCILIVDPNLIISSTEEKLMDVERYEPLGKNNPLPELRKDMLRLWKYGVLMEYVSTVEAEKTVGLYYKPGPNKVNPFTLSTADKFKPGTPYPYPLFKIHKLTMSELEDPNVRPPVRLITDLHDGVYSRSDKFLVWKWLSPLCKDYACDLVKDSSEALLKLDDLEARGVVSDDMLAFGLDVVSLYDSLTFDVVKCALSDAMECCRPAWSSDFRNWIVDLTIDSFESAVVYFKGEWFGVKNGLPTGGIPSVSVANIAVFYVFKKLIYNQENTSLITFLRFVDDGLGIFDGDLSLFYSWFNDIRSKSVQQYGLDLTVIVNPVATFTQFLDIKFMFVGGKLTTDIFKKDTDANRYLSFNSYHPSHTFRSVVYCQGMRYRRIINNDSLLKDRLAQLKTFFIRSGYPVQLVSSILDDVAKKPRILDYVSRDNSKPFITPWVVTYGPGFDEAKKFENEVNELLSYSGTWKDTNVKKIVHVVPRKAPNLKDLLFKRKSLACLLPTAVGVLSQGLATCNAPGCLTCELIDPTVPLYYGKNQINTAGGIVNLGM